MKEKEKRKREERRVASVEVVVHNAMDVDLELGPGGERKKDVTFWSCELCWVA
jgi:hypothetical protein